MEVKTHFSYEQIRKEIPQSESIILIEKANSTSSE